MILIPRLAGAIRAGAMALALAAAALPAASRAQSPQPKPFAIVVRGEVVKPGRYTITPDFSVIDAIEMAGGFTARALRSAVEVARVTHPPGGGGKRIVYRMDYSDFPLNNANAAFKLLPGDSIFVPADPTYGK